MERSACTVTASANPIDVLSRRAITRLDVDDGRRTNARARYLGRSRGSSRSRASPSGNAFFLAAGEIPAGRAPLKRRYYRAADYRSRALVKLASIRSHAALFNIISRENAICSTRRFAARSFAARRAIRRICLEGIYTTIRFTASGSLSGSCLFRSCNTDDSSRATTTLATISPICFRTDIRFSH